MAGAMLDELSTIQTMSTGSTVTSACSEAAAQAASAPIGGPSLGASGNTSTPPSSGSRGEEPPAPPTVAAFEVAPPELLPASPVDARNAWLGLTAAHA